MLAPFFAGILTAIRWGFTTALPFVLSATVAGIFIKIGVTVGSMAVVVYAAETLKGMAIDQLAVIGQGQAGAAVLELLALFGVFEGISLIVSAYLAKATWLAVKPSLTWIQPPTQ